MQQTDLEHLIVKYPICKKHLPLRPSLGPFCSKISHFWDTRLSRVENAPNDLEHSTVKGILPLYQCVYTKYKLPPRSKLISPFCSMGSHFWDTGLLKIGNAPNDPRLTLNTSTVKSSLNTMYTPSTCTYLSALNLCLVWSMTSVSFEILFFFQIFSPVSQYRVESRKCVEWPQSDLEYLMCSKVPCIH